MKTIVFTLLFIFTISFLCSQEISGIVYADDTKEPLLGVNVSAGAHGTITELDGSFSLNITDGTQEIVCSFVGFKEEVIPLTDFASGSMSVFLKASNTFLETAVVTGTRYKHMAV